MTSQHQIGELLERSMVVVTLFVMTAAVIPLLSTGGDSANIDLIEGFPLMQRLLMVLYGLTAIVAIPHRTAIWQSAKRCWPLLLLVVWAVASVAWSAEPELTARRSVALMISTGYGLYLSSRFTAEQFWRLLATTFLIAAGLSFAFVVLMPALGTHVQDQHAGAWRGVYRHKNGLGIVMGVTVVILAWLSYRNPRERLVTLAAMIFCAGLMVLSRSRTGMITCLSMLMLLAIVTVPLIRRLVFWTVVPVVVFILIQMVTGTLPSGEELLNMIGRDATLTGRTMLWAEALPDFLNRPWLGHGYRTYWLGYSGPSWVIWNLLGWDPGSGHNGYVDLLLELGLAGMGLFLFAMVHVARQFQRCMSAGMSDVTGHLLLMGYTLVVSITESVLLTRNNISWITFIASYAFIAQSAKQQMKVATQPESDPKNLLPLESSNAMA